jgi:transposase
MAYIVTRKVKGRSYYFKVEGYRDEQGKVKQRVLEYYGTTDPRKSPDTKPVTKNRIIETYRFGDVALLYHAAERIRLLDIVNNYVPKRQGLSLGLELFLSAAHRLLDDKPSSHNLSSWVGTTHLPMLLDFDPSRITDNTQQYLMDKIYDEERNIDHLYRISIELYNSAVKLFGKEEDTFFYDITSTYFEGKCCPIAFFGHNKDGKLDKLQINIAMIMNGKYGLPVVSKVFRGNVNDARTVHEMVYYPKVIMKKEKCMLIMDRGFDSEDNIRLMDTTKYDYIIGLRSNHNFVKKLKMETDFSTGNWDTIDNRGDEIKLKKESKNVFGKRRTVVLYYSPKVARDQKERRQFRVDNAIERLEDQGELTMKKATEIAKSVRRYLVIEQDKTGITWRINKIELNRAEKNDGKFCLMTNKDLSPKEIFATYFSKDKIEKGFRHMKQDANLRPVHKRLADHVIVDVFICHIAYLLMRVVEHLVQKEKIDKFWGSLSSESKEIRMIELENLNGKRYFQIATNNKTRRFIVDRMRLTSQLPVITTLQK